jgi:hypothetical protein
MRLIKSGVGSDQRVITGMTNRNKMFQPIKLNARHVETRETIVRFGEAFIGYPCSYETAFFMARGMGIFALPIKTSFSTINYRIAANEIADWNCTFSRFHSESGLCRHLV